MTIQSAFAGLTAAIGHLYDAREAANIGHLLMEHITGLGKLDRIVHKDGDLTPAQETQYRQALSDLLEHKPIQHITGKSWFYGLELLVSGQVLIPRPETEELVEWILKDHPKQPAWRLLDVGTGSGCIPVALKKQWPAAELWAMDVSPGAIALATRNADLQHTPVHFVLQDVLDPGASQALPSFNIIISNPPYISEQEKSTIDKHVVEYEPHTALFVPDNNSLIFYEHLAQFGHAHLQPNGFMMMEIHYAKAEAVQQLFQSEGYKTELKKDMQGNDRMIKVLK